MAWLQGTWQQKTFCVRLNTRGAYVKNIMNKNYTPVKVNLDINI